MNPKPPRPLSRGDRLTAGAVVLLLLSLIHAALLVHSPPPPEKTKPQTLGACDLRPVQLADSAAGK